MAGMHHIENDTIAGTIGGTLLAIIPHLDAADITRTIILGGLGAVASFIVTQSCKWLWNSIKNKFKNRHKRSDTKIKTNDKN